MPQSLVERVLGIARTIVPDFLRRRFTLKFALMLVIMGLVIAAIGVTATGSLSTQIEDNTEQEFRDVAVQQADVVETWIERNAIAVTVTSENNAFRQTGTQTDMTSALARTQGNLYGAETLYVIDVANGSSQIAASPQLPAGETLVDQNRSWITGLELGEIGTHDVQVTDVFGITNQYFTAFVTPVPETSGRYLVAEYSTASLQDSLSPASETSRFTRVVNQGGVVQLTSDATQPLSVYEGTQTIQAVSDTVDSASETTLSAPYQVDYRQDSLVRRSDSGVIDEPYLVSYAPVNVSGVEVEWGLLVHQSQSDAFGFVRAVSQWGTIATVASALLIGLLGAVIGFTTTRDLNRLREKVKQMEAGDLEVDIESGRIDAIGQLYDGFASMRDALREQIEEAEQARKEAEVSRAEAMEMNKYLEETAREYSDIMERCAAGDLTQRMTTDGENEAMDQIATDFNEMIAELEKTTGQLKTFADEVEQAGESVETSAKSVRDASEQVAESIQRISDDAHGQRERLQEITDTLKTAIEQFESVTREADVDVSEPIERLQEVAADIEELDDLTEEMMAESENVAGAAEEQAAELNAVSQRANDLTRYAQPLKDVIDTFETEDEHEFYFPTGPNSSPDDE